MVTVSSCVELQNWRPDISTDHDRRRLGMADRLQFAHEYAREPAGLEKRERCPWLFVVPILLTIGEGWDTWQLVLMRLPVCYSR